jgi:predicted Zn-dependent protease
LRKLKIDIPDNNYSKHQDIQIGREAAAKLERKLPIISERSLVDNHVEGVGRRLVNAIFPRYRQRGFVYRFDVVNVRDINAFALPDGPLYVNRGFIEAATNKGQLAGVIAHELIGEVEMEVNFRPTFDYARVKTVVDALIKLRSSGRDT